MRKRTPSLTKKYALPALVTAIAVGGAVFAAVTTGAASKAFELATNSHHDCTSKFGKADTRMTWNSTSLALVDAKGETVFESLSVQGYNQLRTIADHFCATGTLPHLRKETAVKTYYPLGTYACTSRNGRTGEAQEYSNGVRLALDNGESSFGKLNFIQARAAALNFCNG